MNENKIREIQKRLDEIIIEHLDLDEDDDFLPVLFLNGGCYAYATVLKNVLRRGLVVHDKSQGHCALYIDGTYYDINGKVISNNYKFKTMSPADHLYCRENYGFEDSDEEEMQSFVDDVIEKYSMVSSLS